MDKLNEYQGVPGRFHQFRDDMKERAENLKNNVAVSSWISRDPNNRPPPKKERSLEDYPHIYR